jgi:hypothetical protein
MRRKKWTEIKSRADQAHSERAVLDRHRNDIAMTMRKTIGGEVAA